MGIKYIVLWPARQIVHFVLMLFGNPYISPEVRAFAVGVVALWFYIHVARAIIALFKKAFGFQSNERR